MVFMQRAASPLVRIFASFGRDPRHWQLLALGGLFSLSFLTSDFGAKPKSLAFAFGGAFAAQLTGRNVDEIRAKMASLGYSADAIKGVKIERPQPKKTWWQRLWGDG